MVMVKRQYTDISHFRAPFKNWPYLGIGADAGPAAIDPAAAMIDTESNGVRIFKPAIADIILKTMLEGFSVIMLGSDPDSVKLDPKLANDIRESATAWVKRKLNEGKTVVAQAAGGAATFGLPIVQDRFLRAASSTAQELEYTGGVTPLGAVLARPFSKMGLFGLGPLGVAAVVLGVVGVGVYFFGKKKRTATANRRRGTIKHRGTVRKRRRARYKRYGSAHPMSVPRGRNLYRSRMKKW